MNSILSRAARGRHRDLSKERFWRQLLAEHASGGQTVRAFCRRHGLAEPSFYAWRRALADRDRKPAPTCVARRPGFVELRPALGGAAHVEAPLEMVAGDHRLLIRAGCDRALLGEVLAALSRANLIETEA